ncbi:MAG: metal ABC transporter solute-binding protein [Ktedonobacteraceae bacterium]
MFAHRGTWLVSGLLACLLLFSACGRSSTPATGSGSSASTPADPLKVINVVAAENFYGDVVMQLGGKHVNVTSILSDPNVDPHEYTSNVQTAQKVSKADLIIENGLGYDAWMDKLLSASPNPNRILLIGGKLANHPLPDNPHVWYGFNNMPAITQGITDALKKLDSTDAATFDGNLATFKQSLTPLQQKIDAINTKYKGTPIALTETIYLYQTQPAGLNVLTPFEFMKANAEGTDPPVDTVTSINNSLHTKQARILIYNVQTVTPITTNVQNEARKQNIPIVPVSETMPAHKTYQTWMMDQLNALEVALHQGTGK